MILRSIVLYLSNSSMRVSSLILVTAANKHQITWVFHSVTGPVTHVSLWLSFSQCQMIGVLCYAGSLHFEYISSAGIDGHMCITYPQCTGTGKEHFVRKQKVNNSSFAD